ncbi:MAG: recombinase family protein [Nitrososphaerota archaeon]|jgi:DNA invertase Pin-like site-specific DNA recombinase|nr:recombinase family protein [Nitrososphaerota archaeon]
MKQQANKAAIYCRLSRDDGGDAESNSIGNQRDVLKRYALEQGLIIHDEYVDDGISGVTFDRPSFKRMIADIEAGKIGAVLCKDLSRLGRNNAMVAYYTEIFMPDNNVRLIAVNDNIDTLHGENEIMGFKSIINEYYARDISKKIRSTMRNMAVKGEYKAPHAPYGYSKDPADKHRLIVNEETAPIVRKMFQMASEGIAPFSIRMYLTKEKILTPRAYTAATTGKYSMLPTMQNYPTDWCLVTVLSILKNREYLGHVVSQKQTTKSFKNKTCVCRPKDEWVEVRDMHPALVDEQTFDKVQGFIKTKRGACAIREGNIFAGLLKCADCGNNLSYNNPSKRQSPPFFSCNLYRRHSKRCTSHYITVHSLEGLVLGDIRRKAAFAKAHENSLVEYARLLAAEENERDMRRTQSDLEKYRGRAVELDVIIKRLFEQSALGSLTESRFSTLSREYEKEQTELQNKIAETQQKAMKQKSDKENAAQFYDIVHKYTNIEELTVSILHELIDHITIHNAVGTGKNRTQTVEIFYRFVGFLPNNLTSQ